MMKQQLPNPRHRGIETLIHIIVWGIVIGFPFLMMTRSGFNISLADYLRHGSSSTLSFFLVFYINYCLLIPRYLFEGRIVLVKKFGEAFIQRTDCLTREVLQ